VRWCRLSGPITSNKKHYLGIYDEFFINFGRNVAANIFDQNRAYVALGLSIARGAKLEIGYMLQTIQQRNGRIFRVQQHAYGEPLLESPILQKYQLRRVGFLQLPAARRRVLIGRDGGTRREKILADPERQEQHGGCSRWQSKFPILPEQFRTVRLRNASIRVLIASTSS
jgi:hypothetical protein